VIDPWSSCVSAQEFCPARSTQEAPYSNDDELRMPLACDAALCSRVTVIGHAQRRLIIEKEHDLVAAADFLVHQASWGGVFFPHLAAPRFSFVPASVMPLSPLFGSSSSRDRDRLAA
jgi:hypothetical protein